MERRYDHTVIFDNESFGSDIGWLEESVFGRADMAGVLGSSIGVLLGLERLASLRLWLVHGQLFGLVVHDLPFFTDCTCSRIGRRPGG